MVAALVPAACDLVCDGSKMNHFDRPVYEVFSVVVMEWRSFCGAAMSRLVEGTQLATTPAFGRTSADTPDEDAVTRWESEGGKPREAASDPCERENARGADQSTPVLSRSAQRK
jgi:hypothetical protein